MLKRDPDKWFNSMVKHSKGHVVGIEKLHSQIYRRELEYFELKNYGLINEATESNIYADKTMKLIGHSAHYKEIYRLHYIEAVDFFSEFSPNSLFSGDLEAPSIWIKIGKFLGLEVPANYRSHENISL